MFDSPNQSRRATTAKLLVALMSATGCLAAVAYATTTPSAPGRDSAQPRVASAVRGNPRPPRPRIVRHPAKTTLSTRVSFRYSHRQAEAAFQCKLDDGGWKRCGSRVGYRGLAVGAHQFLVRAESGTGRLSRPTRFAWVQAQPKSLAIVPELSALSRLYPGAAPEPVPLVLTNPNSAPILVTAIRVGVAADSAVCPSAENLLLLQSSVSAKAPLPIPAGGSVRLPAPGFSAPAIALRNLPVNQDACQGVQFPLTFSAEARG
jgi:hypothetical protein